MISPNSSQKERRDDGRDPLKWNHRKSGTPINFTRLIELVEELDRIEEAESTKRATA